MNAPQPRPLQLTAVDPERPDVPGSAGGDCCVRRALDAVRAALARDAAAAPDLSELAEAARVSARTLQRRFAEVLGQSPRSVVERLRLDAAQQTLRSGEVRSVVEAALHHGFEHPGRFAIAYARAFGESPSATLRAGRRAEPPAAAPPQGTPILLRPLTPAEPEDAARARRATDDLAIALGRVPGLVLLSAEPKAGADLGRVLRLSGRVEATYAVLSLVRPATGVVVGTVRESFGRRAGLGWAERAASAVRAAAVAETAERARSTPRHRADVETLVARARPAALSQVPSLVGMASDLLGEALHRDPAHPRALALMAWSRALSANHSFARDPEGERERAQAYCARALALAPDDPEVLAHAGGALSLTRRLDEAEVLIAQSLALDPYQPEALRRLGFLYNFRGDGRRAIAAFRRALSLYPTGDDGTHSIIGIGIANFMLGRYADSARTLTRALEMQPARAWVNRFLTAAAVHAGAGEEARRSLASLQRAFPDLTVTWSAQSISLHSEAKGRVLDGLARAGLPT